MRSYKPGATRADEIKLSILEQFKDHGDRRSVGSIFDTITKEHNIQPGRFFEHLGDLEKKKYLSHETLQEGEWVVSVIRRL